MIYAYEKEATLEETGNTANKEQQQVEVTNLSPIPAGAGSLKLLYPVGASIQYDPTIKAKK
uniref:Uncharacterized protein n=1 Tax=Oryza sativa subsp. japonica TaxID=39947 RepID=Q6ETD2_ORYSJ|nr:hypothetical protein [Oryza sativa Japonica Group]